MQRASVMGCEKGCIGWGGEAGGQGDYGSRYWGREREREGLIQAAPKANGRQSNFL